MPTSVRESPQKETPARRKPKGVFHTARRDKADGCPKAPRTSAAGSLSHEIASRGIRVIEKTWRVLPDGTAICLSTGQTMGKEGAEELRLEAERQKALGCGIRLIPATVS